MRPTASIGIGEIEAVYRARIAAFRRVARAITGDAETARDVVQDAFAAAIDSRGRYRPTGSLDAWIWRIVVNHAISERRRLRRSAVSPLPLEPPAHNGNSGEPSSRVAVALALLPERQRLAVFLRYYADLDYAAIGAVLDVSSGTVGASLHAAHETLRAALAPEEAHT